jgi:hypothetical protein
MGPGKPESAAASAMVQGEIGLRLNSSFKGDSILTQRRKGAETLKKLENKKLGHLNSRFHQLVLSFSSSLKSEARRQKSESAFWINPLFLRLSVLAFKGEVTRF